MMDVVLQQSQIFDLEALFNRYRKDKFADERATNWGSLVCVFPDALSMCDLGLVRVNQSNPERLYITQAGADYLHKNTEIITPFDELTAARAEIARLTAELEQANKANAELTAKLKIADAGWSECIDEVAELVAEIAVLKQDSGIPF